MNPPPITATLGLDQASRTGWAIGRVPVGRWAVQQHGGPGTILRHGVATNHLERRAVAELAVAIAGGDPRQLLVMFEQHDEMALDRLTAKDYRTKRRGPYFVERGPKQIHGMGKAYGRWEEQLDLAGHPERLRDEVEPRTWRARVLGTTRGDTEQLKHLAKTWATAYLGEPIDDADEAEGCAICVFSLLDGLARLEGRRQKARLYARGRREERRQLELERVDGRLR